MGPGLVVFSTTSEIIALNLGYFYPSDYPRAMNFTMATLLRSRKSLIWATFTLAAVLISNFVFAPSKAEAATQAVSYFINGDCSDYYDEEEEYAIFEEEEDWTCYVTVKVKPLAPKRKVILQYWDKKWKEEDSIVTSTKGTANLFFDSYCYSGEFCDGSWKFRVLVTAASGQKATNSKSFYINFYPLALDDYNEDYEDQ